MQRTAGGDDETAGGQHCHGALAKGRAQPAHFEGLPQIAGIAGNRRGTIQSEICLEQTQSSAKICRGGSCGTGIFLPFCMELRANVSPESTPCSNFIRIARFAATQFPCQNYIGGTTSERQRRIAALSTEGVICCGCFAPQATSRLKLVRPQGP